LKNPELEKTINELKIAGKKTGHAYFTALSEGLDKAKRARVAVNLSAINRLTEEGEVAVIPGKVLASGKLNHPVTVAAFDFSTAALEKIKAAGGETKNLNQLIKDPPESSKVILLK
jgi:large subunit ribosomal protein L18e